MDTRIVQTKFALGDRVRFESHTQRRRGAGEVFAITIDDERRVGYIIAIRNDEGEVDLQPGILEEEMTLLDD